MNHDISLLLLFGGRSAEHDVSVASAVAMLQALQGSGINVVPLGISREGKWRLGDRATRMLGEGALFSSNTDVRALVPVQDESPRSVAEALQTVNVVFPLLHGPYGEDGTVQGMLELADVPYVGAGVLGSALSMDKLAMKAAFQAAGLPVAPYVGVLRSRWRQSPEHVEEELDAQFGYPMFVKPANMGSSVGITKVHDRSELRPALELAARYDRRLVVEKGLEARELECGVLGNDEPEASVVGEILPGAEYYDFEAKYVGENSRSVIPAELPGDISVEIRCLAVRAFQAVDAAGMARVDFFLVGEREIYINEINTIPGFTPISQFPMLWKATGLEYPALVRRLAELALNRHADRHEQAHVERQEAR
ncbi:MAG: D-alanine--D-alanine ligase [Chloroflexota bacterium]|nr:D-alanine--D-alanine ligase [Chloroflexota bacterium]